jgi:hypothetical protein
MVKARMHALSGRGEETDRYLRLAETIPYEGQLPDGSASVESEAACIRALSGYGGVKSMVDAASRFAELESAQDSPWRMALVKMGLGHSAYLSGDVSMARKSAEEALVMTAADQPLWRVGALYILSLVATDEGSVEEAESLANSWTGSGYMGSPNPPGRPSRSGACSRNAGSWTRPRRCWRRLSPRDEGCQI